MFFGMLPKMFSILLLGEMLFLNVFAIEIMVINKSGTHIFVTINAICKNGVKVADNSWRKQREIFDGLLERYNFNIPAHCQPAFSLDLLIPTLNITRSIELENPEKYQYEIYNGRAGEQIIQAVTRNNQY